MHNRLLHRLLLAVLILMGARANYVQATIYEEKLGPNVTYSLDSESGALTVSGTGAMWDRSTPAEATLFVQEVWIGPNRVRLCNLVKSIVIESGVTTIGRHAFCYCAHCHSVVIPASVTTISNNDNSAFFGCTDLREIYVSWTGTIPAWHNMTYHGSIPQSEIFLIIPCGTRTKYEAATGWKDYTIASPAAYNLTVKTNISSYGRVKINNGAAGINITESIFCGEEATITAVTTTSDCNIDFLQWNDGNKDNPRTVTVDAPITYTAQFGTIGGNCGASGNNLTWSFNRCTGVLTISGSGAMADWSADTDVPWYKYRESITSVVLPVGLTHIGAYAFYATGITKIDIPAAVQSFGQFAFVNSSLHEICIPEGVTTLPNNLFHHAVSLTIVTPLARIYLPSTLTTIGNLAIGRHFLSTLTYPASITNLGNSIYYSSTSPVRNDVYASWPIGQIPQKPVVNFSNPTPKPNMHVPYGTKYAYGSQGWSQSYTIVEDVDERAIDLGLSIRWASCNIGATAPEENGDFYAWGDTATRSSFTWTNYPYSGSSTNTLTKYNTRAANGTIDNRTTLLAFDDVAYFKWGETWRMPTWAEWNELITLCTWKDTMYNDIPVWQVTGPNGNSIYLPKVGYKDNASVTAGCYYWSTNLNTENANNQCNRALYINADNRSGAQYGLRYVGMPVRAVYRREWPSFTLTITDTPEGSSYTKAVNAGSSYTLTAQEDDCHHFVQWSDGNTSNPRTVNVTADATYTAEYEYVPLASGTCGSNLTWTLSCDSILTISGTGEMMNFNNNDLQWLLSRSLIRTVVIEEGVTSIGTWAFKGCTNIEHVEIPSSVTTIGERAFIWAYGLESIHIPEGVVTIEKRVFEGCNNLKNITLPNTLETIGTYCFLNCTSLREITIPNSVSEIGSNALKTCTALTDIHVSWENADAIPDWLNLTNKDPQSDITLHVPCEAIELYKAASYWKDYTIEGEGGPYTVTVQAEDPTMGDVSIMVNP